jgi:hypothetical protein
LVSIPYDQRLQDLYLPSEFTSDEYPNLIPPGEKVDTVAASILLAVGLGSKRPKVPSRMMAG